MRHYPFPVYLLIALFALGTACKKEEQSAPAAPRAENRTTSEKETARPTVPEAPKPAPAAVASADTKDAMVLKLKWPVGNRYVYRMDMDQQITNHIPMMPKPMQQNVTMAMTYAVSVLKELPQDARELELEFLANEMEMKMGDQVMMSFDSKESTKENAQNPLAEPFRKMVGTKVRLQTDAFGKVDKVLNHQEWLDAMTGGAGPMGAMLRQQFSEGFVRQIAGFGAGLPDKPVKVGETWPMSLDLPAGPMGKIQVNSKVTLKGTEDHDQHKCVILTSVGTLEGSGLEGGGPIGKMSIEGGKLQGTSWIDPELGALIETTSDQSMRMQGDMPGQPGGANTGAKFEMALGQKVGVKLVEVSKTDK